MLRSRLGWAGEKILSVNQLCLYCTFAPRRSRPPPLHYAPTTGLDPSPLRDFFLLSRSLLVSDAPGFRTFKPCPDWVGYLLELRERSWISELKQPTKDPTLGAALRSSRAPQENRALRNEQLVLCDVLSDFLQGSGDDNKRIPPLTASIVQAQISSVSSSAEDHLLAGLNSSDSSERVRFGIFFKRLRAKSLPLSRGQIGSKQ